MKVKVKVIHLCLAFCDPPRNSPGWNTGVGNLSLLWGILPTQGSNPHLQVHSLLAEQPGKPKNTVESSLSLLQGIFPTQKLNCGLLNCRRILYQLSYQGSPQNCHMNHQFLFCIFTKKRREKKKLTEKYTCTTCSWQHYLLQPIYGNNLYVH